MFTAFEIYLFAENKPCYMHNHALLNAISSLPFVINSIVDVPRGVPSSAIKDTQSRKQTDTGGLATVLIIKVHVKIMLTVNIDTRID